MSRRREQEQHLRKLGEIGEIMRTMKNLALMETRKLGRFLEAQTQGVRCTEAVAADFLRFHPQFAVAPRAVRRALLLIGSERGFCGDFNEELLALVERSQDENCLLIGVGEKLCGRLQQHALLAGLFEGPAVAEDVPNILDRLAAEIGRLQQLHGSLEVTAWYHRDNQEGIVSKPLLPPFSASSVRDGAEFSHAPLLNLPPEQFFAALVEHYLFAVLHEIFHTSLMAENQRRIRHLEGAIQRLDEKIADIARQCRTLRQEEITEEIEVILLSAEGLSPGAPG